LRTKPTKTFFWVIVCLIGFAPGAGSASPKPVESREAGVAAAAAGAAFAEQTGDSSSASIFDLALQAVACATASGEIAPPPTLTVIDYSRPSTEPRLWVFDLETRRMLFSELVAHGRNTGDNFARHFSDTLNSRQSSLGLFVARDTYVGSNGYSLRLDGLEPGFNGRARERAIVMHGAPYVDATLASKQGRIGRSWGCPAVREAMAREIIDTVRGGGVIFSYYPDETWLNSSRFLRCGTEQTEQAQGLRAMGQEPKV
jgi:hypothetical protein